MATAIASSFTLCQHVPTENEDECQEEQYSLCPHCDLWLCIPHTLDHQQIIQANAHELNDRANQVRQQLTELSIDYLYEDCKKKIDEWRDQIHAEINIRHAEMVQQLTKLYDELAEEVKEFKQKKIESFTHEIVEPLTRMLTKQKQVHPKELKTLVTKLQSLEEKIVDIKKPNVIHMNYDEVKLNGEVNFTRQHPCDEIEATLNIDPSLELEYLKRAAIHRFQLETNGLALAASDNFILTFESPSTLLLFNNEIQLRSIDTKGNEVWDICWSDTMKLFLIAGKKLQTYDIIHNQIVDTSVNNPLSNSNIWSVTSYFHDVLLLYKHDSIKRYSWPSFKLKTMWPKSSYLEENSDSGASCIRLNDIGILAISIRQEDLHWRIDLFDTQMQRIHRGVPLTNNGRDHWNFPFISLTNNEWLVMDESSRPQMLTLVDKNGKLKQQIEKEGYNLAIMGGRFLVLRHSNSLLLYKLSQ
ncbi:unnamed protein product [Rotaria sordida]|uniref:Uncharacterized protein n=1 Tax=Rotaria sordida TaxID=392033 RepID=A0A813WCE2_9BILA|nr:unnamed protein product [Rotaria sordida]CAF0850229.1 unnamed protein product [Rotaria sordida]